MVMSRIYHIEVLSRLAHGGLVNRQERLTFCKAVSAPTVSVVGGAPSASAVVVERLSMSSFPLPFNDILLDVGISLASSGLDRVRG